MHEKPTFLAQAFISFLFKQYKRKKVGCGTKWKRVRGAPPAADPVEEELVLDEDNGLSPEERELAQTLIDIENEAPMDTGEQAHDDAVIKSTRDRAISDMRLRGVMITDEQNKTALGMYPKVAGLARRVHDSASTLGVKFQNLVSADNKLIEERNTLTRRVPTRWNSDYACIDSHLYLRDPVEALTGQAGNKLSSFRLTSVQWSLPKEVKDVLGIFPVIPMIEDIEDALKRIINSAFPVLQKYHSLTDDCEVYKIAIVMCPDKKLQWFKDRGWTREDVEELRSLVVRRWEKSYKAKALQTTTPDVPTVPAEESSPWLTPTASTPIRAADDINTYLDDPVVPTIFMEAAGQMGRSDGGNDWPWSHVILALARCSHSRLGADGFRFLFSSGYA
ncbi:hypothetical protein B0H11DRAFT_2221432 [Mycena galericulata]|nr:hypothetical protein B0H11DRAFT_2221432 [Mycena galericulata]